MDVLTIDTWDAEPQRAILVSLLCGRATLQGDAEECLHALQRDGLLTFDVLSDVARDCEVVGPIDPNRPVWIGELTAAGCLVALRLARSVELLRVIATAARLLKGGYIWAGVMLDDVMRELDLRDHRDGQVGGMSPSEWMEARNFRHVQALPRRDGLDAPMEGPRASA